MQFGEKIKQLRTKANLTQPELATKADIEQSYLSKLENEKGSPSFEVIGKIAKVFQLEAIELIESLDQQYIQDRLSHLPEIAVHSAFIKNQREAKVKRWYLKGVLMILLGVVLFFIGTRGMLFSKVVYEYYSAGVIQAGEPLEQFSDRRITIINETPEEWSVRLKANRKKIDEEYVKSDEYLGESYIENGDVPTINNKVVQRRLFTRTNTNYVYPKINDFITLTGITSFLAGWFFMFFIFRFCRK